MPNPLEKHGFGPTLCSNLSGNTPIWTDAELRVCGCFYLVSTSTAQATRIAAKPAKINTLDRQFAPVHWENSDSDSDRHFAPTPQETRPSGPTPSCVCATVSTLCPPAPHKQDGLLQKLQNPIFWTDTLLQSLGKAAIGPKGCSNLPGNTPRWPDAELRVCDCSYFVSTSTALAERIAAKPVEVHTWDRHFTPIPWKDVDSDRHLAPLCQETRPSGWTPSCVCATVLCSVRQHRTSRAHC